MAIQGEFSDTNEIECMDCGTKLYTEILCSGAGYYLGHFCPNCGPYDRQTEYMTERMATEMYELWSNMATPIFTRSDEFNG